MKQYTVFVHLTAGSLPVRADMLKHVQHTVTGNSSVASRMCQVVTFKLQQQKTCLCARSRLQQRSTSRRATEVVSARVP